MEGVCNKKVDGLVAGGDSGDLCVEVAGLVLDVFCIHGKHLLGLDLAVLVLDMSNYN